MTRRRDIWDPTAVPHVRTALIRASEAAIHPTSEHVGISRAQVHREIEIYRTMDMFWITRQMQHVALDASHDIPTIDTAHVFSESHAGIMCLQDPLPPVGPDGARPVALTWMRGAGGVADAPWTISLICPRRRSSLPWEMMASLTIPPGTWDIDDIKPRAPRKYREGPAFFIYDLSARTFRETMRPAEDPIVGRAVAAFLAATLTLMWQPGIATRTHLDGHTGAPSRPSDPIEHDRAVTLVDLRPLRQVHTRDDETNPETGRTYRHRWVVRGHWRNQAHGKDHAERRLQWIAPYIKGPDGAPLIESEKVMVWRR